VSRRAAGFVLGFALALLIGGGIWWWLGERGGGRAPGRAQTVSNEPREKMAFELYFPADGGLLRAERRELEVTEAPKDRIRKVVEALLSGPEGDGLYTLFPEGVSVGGIQLGAEGTVYVDLRWAEKEEPPASGSSEEMQRVYSLVNSIVLNVPQARRVVLLWNGAQTLTFAGHLDTSRPLLPERAMLVP
jgi:spore germination protein GerM